MKVQPAEATKTRPLFSRRLEAQSGLLVIFLVLILLIVVSSIVSPTFRTGLNIQNVSRQAVALGLVSLGQTFVILGGGIDLSAGSVISLVSCLSAGIMMGQPERLVPVLLGMVLLGTLIGVFNGLLVTRLRIGQPLVGQGYELDSITAVLIGGTALSGGRGGVIGTVIGVLIMIVLNNTLNLMNVTSYWQWIVKGLIIIVALAIQRDRR